MGENIFFFFLPGRAGLVELANFFLSLFIFSSLLSPPTKKNFAQPNNEGNPPPLVCG